MAYRIALNKGPTSWYHVSSLWYVLRMQKHEEPPVPTLARQRFMWGGFLVSPIIFGVIANLIGQTSSVSALPLWFWWATAVGGGVGIILWTRYRSRSAAAHASRIMAWAGAEFVGIFGFVVHLQGNISLQDLYPLLGTAFVLIFLQFPRD